MIETYFREIRQTQRLWQFLVLGVLGLSVPILFQLYPRPLAASLASLFFVLVPGLVLVWEGRRTRRGSVYFFCLGLFLLFLALPQAGVRWSSSAESIAEITILGIKMAWLHKISNLAYLGLLVAALWPQKTSPK